jgi:predicted metallopeptidase
LELRWQEPHDPLPMRPIRGPRRPTAAANALSAAPPWISTGPREQPFFFCTHIRRLLEDIVARTPEFRHIHVPRLLISALQARNGRAHGLQARVTPLRFAHGSLQRRRSATMFQVQRYFLGDHEFLYLMTFCLPRFQDQDFDDKFITLFHELYHIGPEFNGDLRRHHGRCQFHTHSQRHYDKHMAGLARAYLAQHPDPNLHGFLRLNFAQLEQRHGAVAAVMVPRPKMVPLLRP